MARMTTNYPDKKTVAYAELWSRDPFIASTWYGSVLTAERKGDERKIRAVYKLDIPAACFVVWEGTLPSGARAVQLVHAASEDNLANPPGFGFLPIYPGVNLIEFTSEPEPLPEPPAEPEPPAPDDPPEPVPDPPPLSEPLPNHPPRSITIYSVGELTPKAVWWGNDLVIGVPHDWYKEAWEAGPKRLLERIGDHPG